MPQVRLTPHAEIHEMDARSIAESVRSGQLRAVDVLETCLDRIERINPAINAFVFVDLARSRAVARSIDQRVAAGGDPGPLAGVPLGIKELEPVEGWPDTLASTYFRNRVATTTSIMTSRLLRAGAVPVGLTASPEAGRLPFTNSVLHGPTRNPWAPQLTPGGSSGGSAAALAAGLVHMATGSDSAGSVRLPAGWSGVVGVKGTFGRIPRGPGYLGTGNLLHCGPLARSVGDAARYLDCAAGPDERDPLSLPAPSVPYERAMAERSLQGRRIVVLDDIGISPIAPAVSALLREAAEALVEAAGMEEVAGVMLELPSIEVGAAALVYAEADPGLAEAMDEIMENLVNTEGAGPLIAQRLGDENVGVEAITLASQTRHTINLRLAELFDRADLLLLPTSPVPAFGCAGPVPTMVADREVGPLACVLFTAPFNFSGHPVVSVPMGFVDGAPVGMQIVARRHDDVLALAAAAAFERVRPWPKVAPDPTRSVTGPQLARATP